MLITPWTQILWQAVPVPLHHITKVPNYKHNHNSRRWCEDLWIWIRKHSKVKDLKDTTPRAIHNHIKKHWNLSLCTEVRRDSIITAEKLSSMQDIKPLISASTYISRGTYNVHDRRYSFCPQVTWDLNLSVIAAQLYPSHISHLFTYLIISSTFKYLGMTSRNGGRIWVAFTHMDSLGLKHTFIHKTVKWSTQWTNARYRLPVKWTLHK